MVRVNTFDPQKAHEVILFLASRCTEKGYYNILKLLYLADKIHLQRYGSFICGDNYVAMDLGPVPSSTYDLIKAVRDKRFSSFPADFNVIGYTIETQRDANPDFLSESNIECLNEVLRTFGSCSFNDIMEAAHDTVFKKYHKPNTSIPIPIEAIASQLDNSKEVIDYLRMNFG
jgi:uncharacterized phage-associated protein